MLKGNWCQWNALAVYSVILRPSGALVNGGMEFWFVSLCLWSYSATRSWWIYPIVTHSQSCWAFNQHIFFILLAFNFDIGFKILCSVSSPTHLLHWTSSGRCQNVYIHHQTITIWMCLNSTRARVLNFRRFLLMFCILCFILLILAKCCNYGKIVNNIVK